MQARRPVRSRLRTVLPLLTVLATAGWPVADPARAERPASDGATSGRPEAAAPAEPGPVVARPVLQGTSTVLANLPTLPAQAGPKFMSKRSQRLRPYRIPRGPGDLDPVVQSAVTPAVLPQQAPGFPGISSNLQVPILGQPVLPPDTVGDVGPNHYVQMVNITYNVYNKATGQSLLPGGGPIANNLIWAGLGAGSACADNNDGDPIVVYDRLADRWVLTQLALPNFPAGPFYQCIAVSTTPDPTGAFHLYEYVISATKLNDYPKLGVWPDGYYLSANQYDNCQIFIFWITCDWAGPVAAVFDRAQMLSGQPATMVKFEVPASNLGGMLPAHLSGGLAPDPGTPNTFIQVDDGAWFNPAEPDRLQLWPFHVDWAQPANSTFGVNPPGSDTSIELAVAPFDSNMCNYSPNCIPQPGQDILGLPSPGVDALSDRLLHPLNYRRFPTHETIVTTHTVDVGGDRAGLRWYELRNTGGGWTIYQQATYAPADGDHRWMGSIAVNGDGAIALGFSAGSLTTWPSIRYAARRECDPPNTLGPEVEIVTGAGAQEDSSGRWGDYSAMNVDPMDDATFWYTQEHYQSIDLIWGRNWETWIAPLTVASCGPALPSLSIDDVTVTEGNAGTVTAQFAVTLSLASSDPVTVEWATADGTAGSTGPGADYVAGGATLTFPAGETSLAVSVQVNGDTAVEPNETFFVNLSNPSGATVADGQGQGTILNDDAAPPPAASITVTKPNGGETIRIGRNTKIQWRSSNVTGAVDIFLSLSGDSGYSVLFGSTPNDGNQSWKPVSSQATTQGRIRVCTTTAPVVCDASDANFTIR